MRHNGSHAGTPAQYPRSNDLALSLHERLDRAIALFDQGNVATALREFTALIDEGCDEAYYFAGAIYEEGGTGVEQDLRKAVVYYQKSVEEFAYLEGFLALGRLYYYGIGVDQDYTKAFTCYSRVVRHKSNAIAHLMLGKIYHYGHGVPKDLDRAKEHYLRAAKTGNVYGVKGLALVEEEMGRRVRGLLLRVRAGLSAFLIARRNPRDARLRPA